MSFLTAQNSVNNGFLVVVVMQQLKFWISESSYLTWIMYYIGLLTAIMQIWLCRVIPEFIHLRLGAEHQHFLSSYQNVSLECNRVFKLSSARMVLIKGRNLLYRCLLLKRKCILNSITNVHNGLSTSSHYILLWSLAVNIISKSS